LRRIPAAALARRAGASVGCVLRGVRRRPTDPRGPRDVEAPRSLAGDRVAHRAPGSRAAPDTRVVDPAPGSLGPAHHARRGRLVLVAPVQAGRTTRTAPV